ncbi:MAG: lipoyl synthase, partial [Acidimicrobiales bacterium]|nr:lipoyl synthase [Acidimicrobiales bacterium]MYG60489.1 lipoyl synthase [Acidimicrobiales bacterium]
MHSVLQVRWLGRVGFREALDLQRRLWAHSADNYLLLLEHHHVFTAGPSADEANLLVDPGEVGADCVRIDRGGDFTYHGPGQLVGYPILTLPGRRGGGLAETA